jgi:hypothetical protein
MVKKKETQMTDAERYPRLPAGPIFPEAYAEAQRMMKKGYPKTEYQLETERLIASGALRKPKS